MFIPPPPPLLLLLLVSGRCWPPLLLVSCWPPLAAADPARPVAVFPSPPDSVEVGGAVSVAAGTALSLVQCAALCSRSADCGGVVPSPASPASPACRLVTPAATHAAFAYFWAGSGTWSEAVSRCPAVTVTAVLVSVTSEEENAALRSLLAAADVVEAHLALQRPGPGQDWVWTEANTPEQRNAPVTYTLWHSGEPNGLSHSGGLCTVMKSSDGEWYDRKVSDGQVRPILCKYRVN